MNEEQKLIERGQKGDKKAYELIFLEYKNIVYNVAYGMLSNVEDAEDMTQEVFIHIFEKINQFRFKSSFSTWLYRVTVNMCHNEIRKKQRQYQDAEDLENYYEQKEASIKSPEDEILNKERQTQVKNALAMLSEDYRIILILREIEGLSYKKIAKVLQCSLGRVKSRLHEARMELKQKFEFLETEDIKEPNSKIRKIEDKEVGVFCY